MIPVFSAASVRSVDAAAIAHGVPEAEWMDRAAQACLVRILAQEKKLQLDPVPNYHVVAGKGNNGGDGLLIARGLWKAGRTVRVSIVEHSDRSSSGHELATARLAEVPVRIDHIKDSDGSIQIIDNEIIIDCILGTGTTRPATGLLARVVEDINRSQAYVVAIDLPSGTADPGTPSETGPVIRADLTLAIETPQMALLLPETGRDAGSWELLRIGLDPWYPAGEPRLANWVEPLDIRKLLRPRARFTHKGSHGHALLMVGGPGCHGAALLAARGCSRSGVGLFTVHGPAGTIAPLTAAVPDAMSSLDPSGEMISEVPDLERYTSVLFGPGVGRSEHSAKALRQLLARWSGPLVIDADGLNLLAVAAELINALNANVILTPHPREMDRLLGTPSTSGFDRLQRTGEFAHRHGCHIVLKGAYTAVCSPDGAIYFLPTGNAGMAKGGTGDVLAGIIAGLSAQQYEQLDSSLISTYLHGRSGDLAAARLGMDAMRASDLVDHLSVAWKELR